MDINELYTHFLRSGLICTDTRKITTGSIFFALKGDNFNGNKFAVQALEQGCILAVVDEHVESDSNKIIKVNNVLSTLQQLASHHRKQFNIPVIGLTGSNGKTTTKELTTCVLSKKYKVHATRGNLNNHIGVPLTLLSMPGDTEIAIVEMGANHPNDIAELCEIAHPNYGLITNIGRAHLEGFGSLEGVAAAKGQLFDYIRKNGGQLFRNADDERLQPLAQGAQTISYGSNETADVSGSISATGLHIAFSWKSGEFESAEIQTKLIGAYNLSNLLAAVCVGRHFGATPNQIAEALASYTPDNNRSQLQKTEHNTLVLDAYNANPTSMAAALKDFILIQSPEEKWVILGDMLEGGSSSVSEHIAVLQRAQNATIKSLFVGSIFKEAAEQASISARVFDDVDAAAQFIEQAMPQNKLILLKGSRGIGLEKLVPLL